MDKRVFGPDHGTPTEKPVQPDRPTRSTLRRLLLNGRRRRRTYP